MNNIHSINSQNPPTDYPNPPQISHHPTQKSPIFQYNKNPHPKKIDKKKMLPQNPIKPRKQKPLHFSSQQQDKQFQMIEFLGRGTFGTVHCAKWKSKNNIMVAIKSITKNPKFKNREADILGGLRHQAIVELFFCYEKVQFSEKQQKDKISTNLVMEYLPKTMLSLIRSGSKENKLSFDVVIDYSRKILSGLAYLQVPHPTTQEQNICHRDIKLSNILLDQTIKSVKLCDFGSAKQLKKGQKSITYICSRYYRAPELILACSEYSTKIDIWSFGCVMTQMLTMQPLFDGDDNVDQIAKIIKVLGTPSKQDLEAMRVTDWGGELEGVVGIGLAAKIRKGRANCPDLFIDLVEKLLVFDPNKRLSAQEALKHPIFSEQI